jgi:hypothetical protein
MEYAEWLEQNSFCFAPISCATLHIPELRISSNMQSTAYSRGWVKTATLFPNRELTPIWFPPGPCVSSGSPAMHGYNRGT